MYRNKAFYFIHLMGKTYDEAYNYIRKNLECPSFEYERQNAEAAFKEIFDSEFVSPEHKQQLDLETKLKKAEEELEMLKLKIEMPIPVVAAATVAEPVNNQTVYETIPVPPVYETIPFPPFITQDDIPLIADPPVVAPVENPVIMTKEQFKAKFIEMNGHDNPLKRSREWKKYAKEKNIEA